MVQDGKKAAQTGISKLSKGDGGKPSRSSTSSGSKYEDGVMVPSKPSPPPYDSPEVLHKIYDIMTLVVKFYGQQGINIMAPPESALDIPCILYIDPTRKLVDDDLTALLARCECSKKELQDAVSWVASGRVAGFDDVSATRWGLTYSLLRWSKIFSGELSRDKVVLDTWSYVPAAAGGSAHGVGYAVRNTMGAIGTSHRRAGTAKMSWLVNVVSADLPLTAGFERAASASGISTFKLLRSGVIDNDIKRHILESVLQQWLSDAPDPKRKLRIRSLSLLGTAGMITSAETEMTRNQGKVLADIGTFKIVHMNFQATSSGSKLRVGESWSSSYNEKALGFYHRWILQDAGLPEPSGIYEGYERKKLSYFLQQQIIEPLRNVAGKELLVMAAMLLKHLMDASGASALSNVISSISRMSELLSLALLDIICGVVALVNCKSGCDRSGFVHAIYCALVESINNLGGVTDNSYNFMMLCDVCMQWDALNAKLDKRMEASGDSPTSLLAAAAATMTTNNSAAASSSSSTTAAHRECGYEKYRDLVNKLVKEGGLYESKLLLLCLQLKNSWFKSLMEIGWKVIVMSCGVPGFKFGKHEDSNFFRNDMYLSLVPPFVRFKSKGQYIPVPVDEDGDDHGNSSSSTGRDSSQSSRNSSRVDYDWSTTMPLFRNFITDASKWRGGAFEDQEKKK